MNDGTPKTLSEAILRALATAEGPLYRAEEHIYKHVKDFLSQKFGAAYLSSGSSLEQLRLEALFEMITRKETK